MAAEAESITWEMEEDVFTVRRKKEGVSLVVDGRVVLPKVLGLTVNPEDGTTTIHGMEVGKLNPEVSGDLAEVSANVGSWIAPTQVKHLHTAEEFNSTKASGLVCAKFSATWCGPCKRIAPHIDEMSRQFPGVTFIHMDEQDAKELFQREGVGAYPTFKFYKEGVSVGSKVEGGDLEAIEATISSLGGEKVETTGSTEEIVEQEVVLTMVRDKFEIVPAAGGPKLISNGEVIYPSGKCAHVEFDKSDNSISFGKGGGKVWLGGGLDPEEFAKKIQEMFPTEVKHVGDKEEFDKIVQNGITVAKFSAAWCGPCKRIAGIYHQFSLLLKDKVTFLHIDVDHAKELSRRERIEAMPTFVFFKDGVEKPDLRVRGANVQALVMKISEMGVDITPLMSALMG